jgi:histidyl-tRNA synthetase
MGSAKTQPARGMRDFLPADVRRREYVIGIVKQVYERYGFEPLETPAVENIETLLGKYGEESNQLIFKILKRGVHESTGEADLALRYDLTVPLARLVAEYRTQLPKFFRRYQIQPVWRADRPARGRFREFYQCDVDVLGSRSMVVEAEICSAASDVLTSLGFKDFKLKLNHRLVLNGLLEQAGVPTPQQGDALVALDKMDKTGPEGVARELVARGIPGESAVRLMRFFEGLAGAQRAAGLMELEAEELAYNTGVLGRLVEFIGSHEQGARGIDELRQIIQFATASGISSRIKLDPTLARGLSYYTGAIMEISVKDLPGSLGGGGRYDNLVGMFAGEDIPACGFSLGLERIIVVMTEREMFPASLATSPADVLVASLGEEFLSDAVNLATDLRRTGIRVSMYPEAASKPQKPLSYADAQKIPLAILIGEDEHKNGVITVRNLVERQQERPLRDRAVEVVTGMLSAVPKTHG